MRQASRLKPASASPSPRSSRGEGWGEGPLSANSQNEVPAVSPPHPKFSRCENFDLSPQAGRGEESSRTGLDVMIALDEPEARLDLGDLGAAHGHAMGRWAIEFDHRAVSFLADEGDMRDRHDMAAMHPDEQAGIELRFGFRNRPWTHPLAGAVMDPGIVC